MEFIVLDLCCPYIDPIRVLYNESNHDQGFEFNFQLTLFIYLAANQRCIMQNILEVYDQINSIFPSLYHAYSMKIEIVASETLFLITIVTF